MYLLSKFCVLDSELSARNTTVIQREEAHSFKAYCLTLEEKKNTRKRKPEMFNKL